MGIIKYLLQLLLGSGNQSKVLDLIKGQLLGEGNAKLGPLLDQLKAGGLSNAVASWISTGKNEEVSGQQIGEALGDEKLGELSAKSGLPVEDLKSQLAKLLPQVIDRLTPQGKLPNAA